MGLAFNEFWEEGTALLFALINCGYKFLSGLWCFCFIFRVVEMSRTFKENQQSFLLAMSFMLKSYMNLYTNDHANAFSCWKVTGTYTQMITQMHFHVEKLQELIHKWSRKCIFMLKSYMNLYTNDHANTLSCWKVTWTYTQMIMQIHFHVEKLQELIDKWWRKYAFMLKSYMNLYTNDHANTRSCFNQVWFAQ